MVELVSKSHKSGLASESLEKTVEAVTLEVALSAAKPEPVAMMLAGAVTLEVALPVPLGVCVPVAVAGAKTLEDALAVPLGVCVELSVTVAVPLLEPDTVAAAVTLEVALYVPEKVEVLVEELVIVAVNENGALINGAGASASVPTVTVVLQIAAKLLLKNVIVAPSRFGMTEPEVALRALAGGPLTETPEMPLTPVPRSIMSMLAGSSMTFVRAKVLGSPSSAAAAGCPGKVELMKTLAPAPRLMPVSRRPPPVPKWRVTSDTAREAWPGKRMKTHVAMATSCFAVPAQGSPPKTTLVALTVHAARPTHKADTTEKERVALHDSAGISARAVSKLEEDATTRLAAADTAEMLGKPYEA